MKLKDLHEMSQVDLRSAEYAIEGLFKELALDVVWTTHFKERIFDRENNVQAPELVGAFKKLKEKYGARLQKAKDNQEEFVGILKDMATDLNIPFAIDFDKKDPRNNKYRMRGITIMRKDPRKFRANVSGGQELKVEAIENAEPNEEEYVDLPKPPTAKQIKKDGKKDRPYPTTSKSQNKVINMLWNYQNADAT